MGETHVFRRKPGMQAVFIFFAIGAAFIVYILISLFKLKSHATMTLWSIITIPVVVIILLQLFHKIVITSDGIVKGIIKKRMEFPDIIRFGEGTLEKRFREGGSYSTARTFHILLLNKRGNTLRVNWMGYKNGDELKKLLVKRTGRSPEKLQSGLFYSLYFYPLSECPKCGHKHEMAVSRCQKCGVCLLPC